MWVRLLVIWVDNESEDFNKDSQKNQHCWCTITLHLCFDKGLKGQHHQNTAKGWWYHPKHWLHQVRLKDWNCRSLNLCVYIFTFVELCFCRWHYRHILHDYVVICNKLTSFFVLSYFSHWKKMWKDRLRGRRNSRSAILTWCLKGTCLVHR